VSGLPVHWLPAPELDPVAASGTTGELALFERSGCGERIIGFGAADAIEAPGLAGLVFKLRAAAGRVRPEGDVTLAGGALWIGCAPFDNGGGGRFGVARFVLPRFAFVSNGGSSCCAVAGVASRDEALRRRDALLAELRRPARTPRPSEPGRWTLEAAEPPAAFRRRVVDALEAIGRGALQKVVLAREVRASADHPIDVPRLLAALRTSQPEATRFALRREGAWWLGATPEQLVRVSGERVEAAAVAGTVPRGRSPEADAARARALRESKKDQEEHAWVREAVREALVTRVDGLKVPEAPTVRAAGGVYHLHTPLRARRRTGVGALELAVALHPTPAVAGTPTAAAVCWLREREPLIRGPYAGPVGWLGADGSGDLAVALRCALVEGREARCFAGAGIVAGSDPAGELAEIRLKLRGVLGPLLEL
jgi:menaquinone-specific isochorismate synthase